VSSPGAHHSFDAGHFRPRAGTIYRDELFSGKLSRRGRMHAFTCEPFHNLVQRNVIVPDGVTFAARAAGEDRSDFSPARTAGAAR
jgi:hypothetical protein